MNHFKLNCHRFMASLLVSVGIGVSVGVSSTSYAEQTTVNGSFMGSIAADTVIARPLIANGSNAITGQVPWQVALFAQNSNNEIAYVCSGTLVAAQWVLTAAHCFNTNKFEQKPVVAYQVLVGAVDLNSIYADTANSNQADADSAQLIRVNQRVVHPDYNANLNLDNDIALIKLATPVNLKACGRHCGVIGWLQPEPTQPNALIPTLNQRAQVAGWGQVMSADLISEGSYPSRLQVGQLAVANCGISQYLYNDKTYPVSRNMFCARGTDSALPADTCVGDSGSGLVVNLDVGLPVVAGITSWGEDKPCGTRRLASVYTRVANYSNWILSYVDPAAYTQTLAAQEIQKQELERQEALKQEQLKQDMEKAAQAAKVGSTQSSGGSVSLTLLLALAGLIGLRRIKA